jgi:hypothetical protein
MPLIMDAAKKYELTIINQSFDLNCELTIQFPKSKWEGKLPQFIAQALSLRIDQVDPTLLLPQLKWELQGTW